ncbi:hypothetical protein Aph01nite_13050 [Acrocarpospora phusangensis]|uniref:Uncharacterized protein n=1 Tax=Acrocarpospora phusangensis TaxID=1070424 RepID=A0A919Q964_9ACTN|nr:hypothetical protein [Acrocarpospora phusangensis]GIH22995.1 hypothetical protein Aph01nite_13050 [Acrocarpospora phusangensis]
MGRIYAVPFTGTITAAGGNVDIWSFQPADDLPCCLRGFRLGNRSEVGDAAEESLELTVKRLLATVTIGSGGGSVTPEEVGRSNQAPSFTARANDTTVATTNGTTETVEELAWNIRNSPYEIWYPDPKFAPAFVQGEALVIRQETTAADDYTFCGTAWVEEGLG